jgi:hypothetical protein
MREYNRSIPISDKKLWIIGDSNAWSSFGGDSYRPTDIGGYFPIRSSVTSLTINRFIKGDSIGYLKSLPIHKDDLIILYLGEIDLRHSIHEAAKKKKKSLDEITRDLINCYSSLISKINGLYDNRIIVMSPNPPMRDGFLETQGINTSISGTQEDRIFCFNMFNDMMSKIDGIRHLNWTKNYILDDGMIDTTKLEPGNHHIKDYQFCINELDKFIRDI